MAARFRVGQTVKITIGSGTGELAKIVETPDSDGFWRVERLTGPGKGKSERYPSNWLVRYTGEIPEEKPPYVPTPEHLADLKILSDMLDAEAKERDWCEDYREFVKDANTKLTVPLEIPVEDYEIIIQTGDGSGYAYGETSETVTVTAPSEEEAVAKVVEIVDKYLRGELVEKTG